MVLSEWPSRRLRRKYNIKKTVQMNVRAPKAPPMMGPIGSSSIVFPCTKSVVTPGVAPNVGLDEEDTIEYDEEGDNTGEFGVVDGVVVAELRNVVRNKEAVRDDEGTLWRLPSLTIKTSRDNAVKFARASSLYSMVNTWEVLGRTGDWKNSWPHFVVAVGSGVSLTEVPSSIV